MSDHTPRHRPRLRLPGRVSAWVATVRQAMDDAVVGLRRAGAVRPWGLAVGPVGWFALALVALAGWAGMRFAWDELRVVGLTAALALAVSVVFVAGRSPYAVRLELAQHRVVVGERAVGRIAVRNTSSRGTLPAEIELPVGAGTATFPLPRLGAGAEHEDLFAVPTGRRAVIPVGPVRSVRADPLGIARREVRWTEPVDLFVHPRTVSLAGTSAGFLKDLEGKPTKIISPSDVSFHALREYVTGDDRRHVHWKSTARTGQLMVRQYEETRRSHLAIALSTHRADYAEGEDEFELAVSVAGSLGLHAFREERDLTVVTQTGTLHTRTAGRMLDDLTRIERGVRRSGIVSLATALSSTAPEASMAILLVGSGVAPNQLHAAGSRLPLDVRVVAFRCEHGAQPSRRAISDLTVVTLGGLDDLPAAMRRLGDL